MSHDQTLIRMANQIAKAFQAYSHDQAVADVRSHIKSYWAPKMRFEISERAQSDPSGIDPIVLEAVKDFQRVADGAPIPGTAAAAVERGEPLPADGQQRDCSVRPNR